MTKYSEVFEFVLALCRNYKFDKIFKDYGINALETTLLPYMKIAIGQLKIENYKKDLTQYDDEIRKFLILLDDADKLILAKHMLIAYLSSQVFDILQMQLHLQDGDFKTYAESNNLNAKQNALTILEEKANRDIIKSGYNDYQW
ncbi:hypothetical protein KQI61_07795 [Anaerocolumna aminovalerica]|uniref:hypothetical protein n=1 Tax=Anaerocolumna aminovalerica TaxID=1527 RepID=UPI001C0EC050|nr:hypothetical protein [Anaerocolumna aminovalerica]MBU5332099.1 hypothetical protein [Anaerocolumna aminovalerica]